METKSNFNQNTFLSHFSTGMLYCSGIVLAVFSYGKYELHNLKEKEVKPQWDYVYATNAQDKKLIFEIPKSSQPQMPPQLDLNQDIKVVDKPTQTTTIIDTTNRDNTNIGNDIVIAPNPDTSMAVKVDEVNDFPDVEAEFPGGYKAWEKYVLDNMIYPELAIENGECGIVYVTFVIEKNGSVSNTTIRKGVSRSLDQEAKRVIKNSPKWIPGKVGNSSVRTSFTITINFEIQ
jgi:protein TonB